MNQNKDCRPTPLPAIIFTNYSQHLHATKTKLKMKVKAKKISDGKDVT